jgi:hypothetical protein
MPFRHASTAAWSPGAPSGGNSPRTVLSRRVVRCSRHDMGRLCRCNSRRGRWRNAASEWPPPRRYQHEPPWWEAACSRTQEPKPANLIFRIFDTACPKSIPLFFSSPPFPALWLNGNGEMVSMPFDDLSNGPIYHEVAVLCFRKKLIIISISSPYQAIATMLNPRIFCDNDINE